MTLLRNFRHEQNLRERSFGKQHKVSQVYMSSQAQVPFISDSSSFAFLVLESGENALHLFIFLNYDLKGCFHTHPINLVLTTGAWSRWYSWCLMNQETETLTSRRVGLGSQSWSSGALRPPTCSDSLGPGFEPQLAFRPLRGAFSSKSNRESSEINFHLASWKE